MVRGLSEPEKRRDETASEFGLRRNSPMRATVASALSSSSVDDLERVLLNTTVGIQMVSRASRFRTF